ncbi:serine hydrolase domain-containing protein [Streptomyces mangrovisoli]|uniref:Serine hydrolase n=1 Tax=Streptomyces mangrovisoli TaxID=1428628 RepID=A0A1J4P1Z4_9ACTN|nr:serine hydrolase domain-containing protein [Streptomyces mangrovisoli]OIJ67764.1 serine hydrolase [Streptomyces mangrovisoli]
MTRARTRTAWLCAVALLSVTLQTTGAVAAARPERGCVLTGQHAGGAARTVRGITRAALSDLDLKAALVKVTIDGRDVVTDAVGTSMYGAPATPAMHFRTGSVGIVYMGTVLTQLADEGKVSLDDPVSRWLPWVPHGKKITLRMLGASTSGLHDYVTDPAFLAVLNAHPFKHWTPRELLAFPFRHTLWYEPGTNWSYSHANFVLLGLALEKITGVRLDHLLQERVMDPLDLRQTRNGYTPAIPAPVLHAYQVVGDINQESTYWDPSWTTAPGAVLTQDICDLARSAEGIGAGELLSEQGYKTQLDPGTVGLGKPTANCPATICLPQTPDSHFGLGVIYKDGWVLSNPSFSGYAAIQAYLPEQRLAIAVSTTTGPNAPSDNTAVTIAERISQALAPDNPLTN